VNELTGESDPVVRLIDFNTPENNPVLLDEVGEQVGQLLIHLVQPSLTKILRNRHITTLEIRFTSAPWITLFVLGWHLLDNSGLNRTLKRQQKAQE
jgi:hypothetical protein